MIDNSKRRRCANCLRAQCICQWVRRVVSKVELLILQHPLEVDNVKGSARLLALCIAGSKIVTGEVFDADQLNLLLTAPFEAGSGKKQAVLLYPNSAREAPPVAILTPAQLAQPELLRLVVIDGTWRKSRKMLALNSPLQSLPRLGLTDMSSNYRIRKAHRTDQLSTFEATCAALMQLDGANPHIAALLDKFDGFIGQLTANIAQHLPVRG